MNSDQLAWDEVQVECLVRGLTISCVDQLSILKNAIAGETDGSLQVPTKMHSGASKKPDLELNVCLNKLKTFKITFQEITKNEDVDKRSADFTVLLSRCIHVRSRLIRLKSSKRYGGQTVEPLEQIDKLIETINQLLNEQINLEDSALNLPEISAKPVEPGVHSEDEEGSGDKDNLAGPSNQHSTPVQGDLPISSSDLMSNNRFASGSNQPIRVTQNLGDNRTHRPNVNNNLPSREGILSHVADISAMFNDLKTEITQGRPSVTGDLVTHLIPPSTNNTNFRNENNQRAPNLNSVDVGDYDRNLNNLNTNYGNDPSLSGRRSYNTNYKPLRISDWGISFNGKNDAIPVDRFLNRVEFLARENGMPHDRLVIEIGTILQGSAKEYYWLFQESSGQFRMSWLQLRQALLYRFTSNQTDYDIKNSMVSRKHNYEKGETFSEYSSVIIGMSLSLRIPMSDGDLINLLKENMRPGLQLQLAGKHYRTIGDLDYDCRTLEKTWGKLDHYPERINLSQRVSAPMMRRNLNEISEMNNMCNHGSTTNYELSHSSFVPQFNNTGFSSQQVNPYHQFVPNQYSGYLPSQPTTPSNVYQGFSNIDNQNQYSYSILPSQGSFNPSTSPLLPQGSVQAFGPQNQNRFPPAAPQNVNNQRPQFNTTFVVCWNCLDIGHVYMDCPTPSRGIFCYGCGERNILKPNCRTCQGKVRTGVKSTGAHNPNLSVPKTNHEEVATNTDPELKLRP